MPLPRLIILPALLCAAAAACAQDNAGDDTRNAIRVTTALHDDGTKTVTEVRPEEHASTAITYDAADHMMKKVVYALNDQNLPATGVVYGPNGKAGYKTMYKYDGASQLLEEDDFTLDDQLLRRFVYEYGSNGKVSRIRVYDPDGNELTEDQGKKDQSRNPPRRR